MNTFSYLYLLYASTATKSIKNRPYKCTLVLSVMKCIITNSFQQQREKKTSTSSTLTKNCTWIFGFFFYCCLNTLVKYIASIRSNWEQIGFFSFHLLHTINSTSTTQWKEKLWIDWPIQRRNMFHIISPNKLYSNSIPTFGKCIQ